MRIVLMSFLCGRHCWRAPMCCCRYACRTYGLLACCSLCGGERATLIKKCLTVLGLLIATDLEKKEKKEGKSYLASMAVHHFLGLIFLLTTPAVAFEITSFCRKYSPPSDSPTSSFSSIVAACDGRFPIQPTQNPLIPWIWDAVYDRVREQLDITMVVRDGCSFNRTRWHELVEMFPQFAPKLANGDESKLLVRWFKDESVPVEERKPFDRHSFVRNQLFCEFFDFHNLDSQSTNSSILLEEPILTTKSLPVAGNPAFSIVSTLQVRCPLPKDRVFPVTSTAENGQPRQFINGFRLRHPKLSASSSDLLKQPVIPFCDNANPRSSLNQVTLSEQLPTTVSEQTTSSQYSLSVCSASSRIINDSGWNGLNIIAYSI